MCIEICIPQHKHTHMNTYAYMCIMERGCNAYLTSDLV